MYMDRASLEQEKAQAEKKLRQLQNRQKILQNRISDAERRARTHRLIEHGAVLENIFPQIVSMSSEEVKEFLLSLPRPKEEENQISS